MQEVEQQYLMPMDKNAKVWMQQLLGITLKWVNRVMSLMKHEELGKVLEKYCQTSYGRYHFDSIVADGMVASKLPELFDNETDTIICSGDRITVTTPDPEKFPLPDLDLLDLQWTLHRLGAMCAAAGWQPADQADDDDDDDDEIYLLPEKPLEMCTPISHRTGISQKQEAKQAYFKDVIENAINSWNLHCGH
ncbi:hypothetical protein BO83DRAFT_388766 [Aspergillus eucalypticola CBS 122712]|uniref:Uncharacterized protein n=1 Tax=Aspergillus eucalypticola (strain CBS 122712 / IBT 29274) TaxID=1448314 RepID=A0A317VG98_ASPEC|nr:uncharacterized protein BO83DRAFT_388766 [Aspergillus eucalypticola CBS 122712]PWY73404.1 hypothetical protein BO83DRAFT_388766 [Aspergillus eucalypticola CBS 122712]